MDLVVIAYTYLNHEITKDLSVGREKSSQD